MPAVEPQLAARPTALKRLIQAKQYSDRRDYRSKIQILRQLIDEDPKSFHIDSEMPGGIVGLTHGPTRFKIHMPRTSIPGNVVLPQIPAELDLMDQRSKWVIRPQLDSMIDSVGDKVMDMKKSAACLPLCASGVWYHTGEDLLSLHPNGDDPETVEALADYFRKHAFVRVERDSHRPDTFLDEPWVTIKAAYSPVARAVTDLTGFTEGPVNRWYGGPNPIAGTLLGGLAGAGLGYGLGALSEGIGNATGYHLFKNRRLRKSLGVMGGLAGAIPGAMWAYSNTMQPATNSQGAPSQPLGWKGLFTQYPKNEQMDPPPPPPNPEKQAMDEVRAHLESFLEPDERPNFAVKCGALNPGSGALGLDPIDVDAFGKVVWSPVDPYTPPNMRAAVTGLVDAAGYQRGGSDIISVGDVVRAGVLTGVNAGISTAVATAGARMLGALAGLDPAAQTALQRAGTWYGVLRTAVPLVFGR